MRRTFLCLVIAAASACTPKEEAVPPTTTIIAPSTSARTDDDVDVEVRLIEADEDVPSEEQSGSPPKTIEDPPQNRRDKKPKVGQRRPSGDGPAPDPLLPAPEASPPPVRQATTETVNGEVDPTSIQRAVTKEHHLFVRCLRVDASIELEATIAPSGRVAEARSDKSIPDDPKLRDCLVEAFKQLTIQPHTSASAARVKLALALRRRATG